MNIKLLLLAIIQGLTEFLPVSSSGHLVIFNKILSAEADLFYYVVLHLGTVFSLLVFFYKDILKVMKNAAYIKKILLVTIITGILGILGKDFFKQLFSNYKLVLFALFVNGLMLIIANRKITSFKKDKPTILDSLILGFTQAIAIIPGISRSGTTISTLLFRKIKKEEAFRFSFLIAIPIIFASFVFELEDSSIILKDIFAIKYILGFFIAFIVGYISLFILHFTIKKARLDIFGYYCLLMSTILLLLSF